MFLNSEHLTEIAHFDPMSILFSDPQTPPLCSAIYFGSVAKVIVSTSMHTELCKSLSTVLFDKISLKKTRFFSALSILEA